MDRLVRDGGSARREDGGALEGLEGLEARGPVKESRK